MNKETVLSLICGSVVFVIANAHAQTAQAPSATEDYQLTPYVQGSFGFDRFSSPSATGMAMDLSGSSNKAAVHGTAGLQINPYFGVEGSWFQLPSSNLSTSVGRVDYKGSAYVASVTGTLPLVADVDLVGRLGAGRSDVDVNVASTAYSSNTRQRLAVWGIGAHYNLDKSTALTLDYDNLGAVGKYALGDSLKVGVTSIGIRVKF